MPERSGDDALAGSGQVLRRTALARSVRAPACSASDGVAGAVRGLVIAETFVLMARLCQWQPMRRLCRTVAKRDSN